VTKAELKAENKRLRERNQELREALDRFAARLRELEREFARLYRY